MMLCCAVGTRLPVYIDIHGGGFTYGYKELNRNFNVHLAEYGIRRVLTELSPGPADRLEWVSWRMCKRHYVGSQAHLADYPVNPNAVFLTGDSAGGALTHADIGH